MATLDSIRRNKLHYGQYERGSPAISFICLMGRYQAGKSVFINEFTQRYEPGKFAETGSRTTVVEESGYLVRKDISKGFCFVEIPGFQNEPPHDGDGAIIRKIAKFLVRVYEVRGFAGLVYLHDFSQSVSCEVIEHDVHLFRAMIGSELYDHTALVLNKYRDELRAEFPMRQPEMEAHWGELTADNRAVIRENRAPRGEPRPIVELIWDGRPDAFSLAKELKSGMKLCQTSVGKVYRKLLEKELDGMKHGVGEVSRVRRDALKKELKKWKKCKDTYSDLLS